ncbi:Leucine-rich_repeat domain superfamily [Hexamita inflata]|uniref:Leucine-rich repeat domain superfamily n=1 Tax=Hexamita inflata TaxID=28002 RepID=A0AA86RQ18_9EUKA|nr:Leucine-rich repeat domain superfamily [Hexamita inflata]
MTEKNENATNEEYDEYMTRKYQGQIEEGNLEVGDQLSGDPEVTNLRFLEKIDISTLNLYISSDMSIKLKSNTLKVLTVFNLREKDEEQQQRLNMQIDEEYEHQYKLNLNIDDLELENLEVLNLQENNLKNNQLNNLAKFKKLHTLNVSWNRIDLMNIHNVTSLAKLFMRDCRTLTQYHHWLIWKNLILVQMKIQILVLFIKLKVLSNCK